MLGPGQFTKEPAILEGRTIITVTCGVCEKPKEPINLRDEDWKEYTSDDPNRRYVQEIFYYLDANQRELLTSGTCGECFDALFSEG